MKSVWTLAVFPDTHLDDMGHPGCQTLDKSVDSQQIRRGMTRMVSRPYLFQNLGRISFCVKSY